MIVLNERGKDSGEEEEGEKDRAGGRGLVRGEKVERAMMVSNERGKESGKEEEGEKRGRKKGKGRDTSLNGLRLVRTENRFGKGITGGEKGINGGLDGVEKDVIEGAWYMNTVV